MTSNDQILRDYVVVCVDDTASPNDGDASAPSPELEVAIRTWLQPTKYNAETGEYSKHKSAHLPGTGDWLWNSAPFIDWHNRDDQGTLRIKGIPGSGKSVIAASLIERLLQENVPVLFFFFRQIIDANHSPSALLRDWLDQISGQCPLLQARLKKTYIDSARDIDTVSVAELWRELIMALEEVPKAYCVVDALDEMDQDNNEFLRELADLGLWRPSEIKIAMTSRPVITIERPLRRQPILEIRLQENFVDLDIATYVDHRLHRSAIPTSQHDMIKQAVPGRANGLFLYAKLAMDNFLQGGRDVQNVLDLLPMDLNSMYADLLCEHARRSGISHELQLLILSCATHAARPLRVLEIAEMINVTQTTEIPGGLLAMKNLVRTACGTLLEVLPNETVSVIHHSLTEYLNGETRKPHGPKCEGTGSEPYPVLEVGQTNNRLAEICISYILTTNCLDSVTSLEPPKARRKNNDGVRREQESLRYAELCTQHPFLDYSLRNWHWHAQRADKAGSIQESRTDSLGQLLSTTNFPALISLTCGESHRKGQLPLHFAARFGLRTYLEKYLNRENVDLGTPDSNGETAVHHAAAAGQTETIRVLLANGAKPNEPSNVDGEKPLHKAAKNNHGEVVRILLEAGVHPLTPRMRSPHDQQPGSEGVTPLGFAILDGHEDAAKAFLPYLKDHSTVKRALAWSIAGGHRSLAKFILTHPLADVNARLGGNTPLYLAGKKRDVKTMMTLIEAGADPSLLSSGNKRMAGKVFGGDPDDDASGEYTPLHALCGAHASYLFKSNPPPVSDPQLAPQLVSLMVEGGLDINARHSDMGAAIIQATKWFPSLVAPLLEAGACAQYADGQGNTALHFCSDPETLELLVKKGMADINHSNLSHGLTPFLAHVGKGVKSSRAMIEKLAELGADLAQTNHDGEGAMYHLIQGFERHSMVDGWEMLTEFIDLFVSLGVPIDSRDNEGKNILSLIRNYHDPIIITMLVSAGADVNARDHNGWTPIFHVAKSLQHAASCLPAVQSLIDLGARVDVLDFRGRNLLFSRWPYDPATTEFLIQKGVDPNACDYEGNPPEWSKEHVNNAGRTYLHHLIDNLASGRSDQRIRIDGIPNIDYKDKDGIRPLHLASRFSEATVAALLAAGVSPTEPTHEGITPLHVAARFRRPNIVSMLLEAIETKRGKDGVAAHLSTSWRRDLPPALNFACRSGIPETVSLLLAAGADPNLPRRRSNWPLWWCVEYEEEQKLWEKTPSRHGEQFSVPFGIKFNDSFRSYFGDVNRLPHHVPRLEEIMDLLHEYGARIAPATEENQKDLPLDYCIQMCRKGDYTLECLFRMRKKILNPSDNNILADDSLSSTEIIAYAKSVVESDTKSRLQGRYETLVGLYRREATQKALCRSFSSNHNGSLLRTPLDLESLFSDHQWEVINHLSKIDPKFFWEDELSEPCISNLVSLGLCRLVRSLLTGDQLGEIEKKHEELLNTPHVTHRNIRSVPSLLSVACARRVGNMPMLTVLVEDLSANVNLHNVCISDMRGKKQHVKGSTALHIMSRLCFPWHIAEGVPYLIRHGANLESRDECGQTPLHCALRRFSPDIHSLQRNESGSQQMAKTLIDCGADLNAIDGLGRSCLSHACDDLELVKYMIGHGAKITTRVFFEITCETKKDGDKRAELLDLLCLKADLSRRLSLDEFQTMRTYWSFKPDYLVEHHEIYLLYLVVSRVPETIRRLWSRTTENMIRREALPIARALVRNGADPFVKYNKRRSLDPNSPREEVTLIHDVLEEGGVVEPILRLPDLDLEHRDNKGRTLLLAACRSQIGADSSIDAIRPANYSSAKIRTEEPSLIEFLVDKGACVTAIDHEGKSALHHILESRPIGGDLSLRLLISIAPELVGQLDNSSTPPINYSLRRTLAYSPPDCKSAEILLNSGADPHILEPSGNTALHYISVCLGNEESSTGDLQEARLLFLRLLSVGLSINSRNNEGETPIFFFMRAQGSQRRQKDDDDVEVDTTMQQRRWDEEAKRQRDALKILSGLEADLHVVSASGDTLLHVVSSTSNARTGERIKDELMIERFQWLLDRGLDSMAENDRHQTCLDVAASSGNQSILNLFERPT